VRLSGRTAIVTGGNTGIGLATSRLFAAEGAQVMAASLGDGAAVSDIANVAFQHTDVTDTESIRRMVAEAVERFGRIDVLFCNAGFSRPGSVLTADEEDWARTLAVNLTGTFLCCRYVVPIMLDGGGGSIIINSSQQALVGSRNSVAYTASKGALVALTRAMAIDHAQQGIRVNAICPGAVETDALAAWFSRAGAPDPDAWRRAHPLGRFGLPADVAHAALYLASAESAWVTGSVLVVDGGFSAQ
jgi:meso-butanediol dehydrogenase / (S,S)-butanediol dehydrogenase / diacetyl reductase